MCANLPGIFPKARYYTSHAQAAGAFADEVRLTFAKALFDALDSGNPYQSPSKPSEVASVLVSWGSDKYASVYLAAAQGQQGGGGPGGGIAPRTHKAWVDLQGSINTRLPNALRDAEKANRAALRTLSRARKVRQ